MLKQADLAMYAAKDAGRGGYCVFEADMLRLAEERRTIEAGLNSAIANGEFELYYQPIRQLRNRSHDEIALPRTVELADEEPELLGRRRGHRIR